MREGAWVELRHVGCRVAAHLPRDAYNADMNADPPPPMVFLSHAWEDKERFVLAFATRLRSAGVEVWLDKWEIYPGDSLVDRIFEEGLKNATAVIVILSSNSVEKKWVREELNAGVVARITKGTRLIPVILDDVSVPVALKSTAWVKIVDLENYDTELDRVTGAIFDQRVKPPVGPRPGYTATTFSVAHASQRDARVLQLFCEGAVTRDDLIAVNTDETAEVAAADGIALRQFLDSATVLVEFGYLKAAEVLAPVPPFYSVTALGFDAFVRACVPDYDTVLRGVISEIVNSDNTYNQEIMSALDHSDFILVDHALEVLSLKGLVQLSRCIGHHTYVTDVSPRLRRLLEGG